MNYYIFKKAKGVITLGTPYLVHKEQPLLMLMNGMPDGASLYLSVKEKTVRFTPGANEGFVVPLADLVQLMGENATGTVDVKLMTDKPIKVWKLDKLVVQKTFDGNYIVSPDINDLRESLAEVTKQCLSLTEKVIGLEKETRRLTDIFDGDYITE